MNARTRRTLALALPVLVLVALIIRAEIILSAGREYVVNIAGYDPRDLLRGQYLAYRVQWNSVGSCESGQPCCVCFLAGSERVNPRVRMSACGGDDDNCEARTNPEALGNLEKFFVQEDLGLPLERAIRKHRGSLRIAVSRRGDVIVKDLLLDGEPWRDVVARPPGE